MSKRTRRDRVAGLELTPGLIERGMEYLRRGDVLLRLGLCALASIMLLFVTRAWEPPLIYREGMTPRRAIVANVEFRVPNPVAVKDEQDRAQQQARRVYSIHPVQLRASLQSCIAELTEAKKFDANTLKVWKEFLPATSEASSSGGAAEAARKNDAIRRQYESFRAALAGEWRLKFDDAVKKALSDIEDCGVLQKLANTGLPQNEAEIIVYPENDWSARKPVPVEKVRIAEVKPQLYDNLAKGLKPLEADVIEHAHRQAKQVYANNPEPLVKLRSRLVESLTTVAKAKKFNEETAKAWLDFLPKPTTESPLPDAKTQQQLFEKFQTAIATDQSRADLAAAVAKVLAPYEKSGLLARLMSPEEATEWNQEEIVVFPVGSESARQTVKVPSVLVADVEPKIRASLEHEIKSLEVASRIFIYLERELPGAATLEYQAPKMGEEPLAVEPALADRTYDWLEKHLVPTLIFDDQKTLEIREAAAHDVKPEKYDKIYTVGTPLVPADQNIDPDAMLLLRQEHKAMVDQLTVGKMMERTLAVLGLYLALYTLCGFYLYYRYPGVLSDLARFTGLLALAVLAIASCYWLEIQRAEMVPLLLFGMTVTIAYHQELALLLLAVVGLVVVLSLGHGLPPYVVMTAAGATAVLLLRRLRTRTKLFFVGVVAGLVGMFTTIGVAIVDGQALGWQLLHTATLAFGWGLAAGVVMWSLLPLVEKIFGVLTDFSLLELDVAHPLLQELVRRAPGTYNHSINVASMAEAAAERVGAQGLLVRVGAYFHDIGKILKPQYFVENQQDGDNRHESLVPAMSTLIIIAHVKDGADLARQHHLPRPIIDFIQQHHGTTLVEYFYRRASQQSGDDPDAPQVDENAFRYPGPKPQTKEAGILMLSDAIESASRVLVEPTPARIENLVSQITMNRLLDGQFDECGLTLQDVHAIQESLVKSLTAMYHGRVKYPEPITA